MNQQMTPFFWLKLPIEVRFNIAKLFDLHKSQGAVLQNLDSRGMIVVSDGYTDKDLAELTVEKMQKFLKEKTEKDFWKLFDAVVEKVKEIPQTIVEIKTQ